MRKNGRLTVGKVTNVYSSSTGGINIDYEFYVDSKKIRGSEFYFVSSHFIQEFQKKTFPVIYSSSNHDRSRMLILKSNFTDFDIQYPDSLAWVLKLGGL